MKPNQRIIGQMPLQVRFRVGDRDIQGNRPLTLVFPNGTHLSGLIATPTAIEQLLRMTQQQQVPNIITPINRGVTS